MASFLASCSLPYLIICFLSFPVTLSIFYIVLVCATLILYIAFHVCISILTKLIDSYTFYGWIKLLHSHLRARKIYYWIFEREHSQIENSFILQRKFPVFSITLNIFCFDFQSLDQSNRREEYIHMKKNWKQNVNIKTNCKNFPFILFSNEYIIFILSMTI